MTKWLRSGVVGLSMISVVALPACYAEVAAPVAPPPVQVEVMPAREGFIWVNGHHEWRGGAWVLVKGHYEAVRAGHRWEPGHYAQTNRGHVWVPGHWVRF